MTGPLNLARRPVRNERLPTLLLALATAILVFLSARHAQVAIQLRHGGARDVEGQVAALDAEAERLRAEAATLNQTQPSRSRLEEWTAVKELVDRRAFSWTGLLSDLGQALPPTVRLTSISPAGGEGALVSLNAIGRGPEDAIGLMKALQASPAFEGAFLHSASEMADGVQIVCTVRYVGRPLASGAAAPRAVTANGGGQ